MDKLDAILDRLRTLEDQNAIANVLFSYAHFIDRGEVDQLVDLFTPDARFRARVMLPSGEFDKDMIDISGREALRAFGARIFRNNTTPPNEGQVNVVSQPLITVEGDRATAWTYQTIVRGASGNREVTSFGRYQDVLVRCDDGRWRLQDRISEVENMKRG
jgi:ketosteroid isomerase-like protein